MFTCINDLSEWLLWTHTGNSEISSRNLLNVASKTNNSLHMVASPSDIRLVLFSFQYDARQLEYIGTQ